jgi:hypothetical protein
MGPCYTPSLRDRAQVLKQLRECRTFSFGDVMNRGAEELEAAIAKIESDAKVIAALREALDEAIRYLRAGDDTQMHAAERILDAIEQTAGKE